MKFSEALNKLSENNKETYQTRHNQFTLEISISESGFFYLEIFNHLGERIEPSEDMGRFNGNVQCDNAGWELKKKQVDFMTAVNSGRKFKPVGYGEFKNDEVWSWGGLTKERINGKWEIE